MGKVRAEHFANNFVAFRFSFALDGTFICILFEAGVSLADYSFYLLSCFSCEL